MLPLTHCLLSFFFNDTATTEIYTLSLHDALPICAAFGGRQRMARRQGGKWRVLRSNGSASGAPGPPDRKSTRLNSSHLGISYAVFCLKKKKKKKITKQKNNKTLCRDNYPDTPIER